MPRARSAIQEKKKVLESLYSNHKSKSPKHSCEGIQFKELKEAFSQVGNFGSTGILMMQLTELFHALG